MKTKEQILRDYVENNGCDELCIKDSLWEAIILEAMEEYASEQCQKRDELIKAQAELITWFDDEKESGDAKIREKIETLKSELK